MSDEFVPDGEAVGEGVEAPLTAEELAQAQALVDGEAGSEEPVDETAELARQLAERTEDLQRVQAEYVNYKRRVDRDREAAKQAGIEKVVGELLPTLDAIALADQHDELTGGFKAVADEIARVAAKFGLEAYAEVGDVFDPQIHDALMQIPGEPGQTDPLVGQVLQIGYRLGDRIVRHARVAVAEPQA